VAPGTPRRARREGKFRRAAGVWRESPCARRGDAGSRAGRPGDPSKTGEDHVHARTRQKARRDARGPHGDARAGDARARQLARLWPLGLTIAPNGDVLSANAGDGDIVETTPAGAEFQPFEAEAGAGGLFGLAIAPGQHGVYFVNDTENTLQLLH
jgi:hypothetical protein